MSKKRIAIIALAAALLLALVFFFIVRPILTDRGTARGSLTISTTSLDERRSTALLTVLARFKSLYPDIAITLSQDAASLGAADVKLISNTRDLLEPTLDAPVAWSGDLWLLAGRKEILDALSNTLPNEIRSLRAGEATAAQFTAILVEAKKNGYIPFTLGNSHKWPFLLLLQHWTAATAGSEAASTIPLVGNASDNSMVAATKAFNELMNWKKTGLINENLWDAGWAEGLFPLDRGEAAFGFVSAEYLTPISEPNRVKLEFIPFPKKKGEASWSVGNGIFLAINRDTKYKAAARLLVKFLTSPGVTEELTRISSYPFFSWSAETGKNPVVLASWIQASMTSEYERLRDHFDPSK